MNIIELNKIVNVKEKKVKLVEFIQMNHRNKLVSYLSKSNGLLEDEDEVCDIDMMNYKSDISQSSSRSMSVESVVRNININEL